MATNTLDALPKELLVHIAVSSDALGILHLSQTCRTLRHACYDSLVFRELLQNQQSSLWTIHSLDFDAIDQRCHKEPALWAKYAVADQRAQELSEKECPLETPENFLGWLPELSVVKHPFLYQQCWGRFLWDPERLTARQMFCFAMAILAQPQEPMPQLEKSLAMHEDEYLRHDESSKAYFWGLCFMILKIRKLLRTRRAAWPFNNSASVPYISLPTAVDLDMRPTNASYKLPLPFADDSGKSLNWDSWYFTHGRAMSGEYLVQGSWRGYYTYFRSFFSALDQLDPPMVEIEFVRRQSADGEPTDEFELVAEGCRDGVGSFVVVGRMAHVDDVYTFRGYKAYGGGVTDGMGAGVTWNWRLKCTPLGMVGYWGIAEDDGELERNGCVWLWKGPS